MSIRRTSGSDSISCPLVTYNMTFRRWSTLRQTLDISELCDQLPPLNEMVSATIQVRAENRVNSSLLYAGTTEGGALTLDAANQRLTINIPHTATGLWNYNTAYFNIAFRHESGNKFVVIQGTFQRAPSVFRPEDLSDPDPIDPGDPVDPGDPGDDDDDPVDPGDPGDDDDDPIEPSDPVVIIGRNDPQYDPPEQFMIWRWVDAENGDDGNDGSEAAPWATIQRGCQWLTGPGRGLNVIPGDYSADTINDGDWRRASIEPAAGGTSDLPVVIRKAPGTEGSVRIYRTVQNNGRALLGAGRNHHVWLIDLEVDAMDNHNIALSLFDADYSRVIRCHVHNVFHNFHDMDNTNGIRIQGTKGAHIYGCEIHTVYNGQPTYNAAGIKLYGSLDCVIAYNEVYDCVAGIRCKSSTGSSGYGGDHPDLPDQSGTHNNEVMHNYVHDCSHAIGVMAQNIPRVTQWRMHHNVIENCANPWIMGYRESDGYYEGLRVYNNLIVNYTSGSAISVPYHGETMYFYNNIAVEVDGANRELRAFSLDGIERVNFNAYNRENPRITFDNGGSFSGIGSGSISGIDETVEFEDFANKDYRLAEGSQLIGAGYDGADMGPLRASTEPTWAWWIEGAEMEEPEPPVEGDDIAIMITHPSSGATVDSTFNTAASTDGPVTSVDWYFDGNLVDTATESPWVVSIDPREYVTEDGNYVLRAVAHGDGGQTVEHTRTIYAEVETEAVAYEAGFIPLAWNWNAETVGWDVETVEDTDMIFTGGSGEHPNSVGEFTYETIGTLRTERYDYDADADDIDHRLRTSMNARNDETVQIRIGLPVSGADWEVTLAVGRANRWNMADPHVYFRDGSTELFSWTQDQQAWDQVDATGQVLHSEDWVAQHQKAIWTIQGDELVIDLGSTEGISGGTSAINYLHLKRVID